VSVALGIQHAMRLRHIVICGLPDCTLFFHLIFKKERFSKTRYIEHKIFLIFPTNLYKTFLILGRIEPVVIKNIH